MNSYFWSAQLSLLKFLVNLDTAKSSPQGIRQGQELVARELETMGFRTQLITAAASGEAPLLVGRRGQDPLAPTVAMIAHMDCVTSPQQGGEYRLEDEGWASGAGIADDKGGVVMALSALKIYTQRKPPAGVNLLFICSPNEEIGSPGWHRTFAQLGRESDVLLGFEPAFLKGDVISQRKGNRWYRLKVWGEAGHSGRLGNFSRNANHELIHLCHQLLAWRDRFQDLSININGLSSSGRRFNIVCDEVEAKIDVRFSQQQELEAFQKLFDEAVASLAYGGLYSIEDHCPCLEEHRPQADFFEPLLRPLSTLEELPAQRRGTGGAADINHFAWPHHFALDGLGPIAEGIHQARERIYLPSLEERAHNLASFLPKISQLLYRYREDSALAEGFNQEAQP